eukprot:NODE_476_length_7980_cov_0.328258.p3 type:complete len:191 gc:universal NODE_476_length_7980_cov_0.328258:4048-3476(-)
MILASGSPRRQEILKMTGETFEVVTSNVDECSTTTDPVLLVKELAIRKASAVFDKCILEKKKFELVIGADTLVVIGDMILGKPVDLKENMDMLLKLNNNSHFVYSGVSVIYNDNGEKRVESIVEKTTVFFADNPHSVLKYVCNTKDGLDKAGGYGIQNFGGLLVEKIHGCYYNIMGLPINKLLKLINFNG